VEIVRRIECVVSYTCDSLFGILYDFCEEVLLQDLPSGPQAKRDGKALSQIDSVYSDVTSNFTVAGVGLPWVEPVPVYVETMDCADCGRSSRVTILVKRVSKPCTRLGF